MLAALTDVMDALAGIKPSSALDTVRTRRPQAREQAEASFRALFEPESFAGVSASMTSVSATGIALLRVLSNQPCRAATAPVRIQPSAGATTSATSSIDRRIKG